MTNTCERCGVSGPADSTNDSTAVYYDARADAVVCYSCWNFYRRLYFHAWRDLLKAS